MASREERMQSRLRGAQRRQVKEVDFDLGFPVIPPSADTPAPPLQPSPQPELPLQSSLLQTPSFPPPSNTTQQDLNRPVNHSGNDANISAKRRRLDTDIPPSSTRSTRSQTVPRPDIYAIVEEAPSDSSIIHRPIEESLLETTDGSIEQTGAGIEPNDPVINQDAAESIIGDISINESTFESEATPQVPKSPVGQMVDTVTESPRDAPGSGRRTRVLEAGAMSSSSRLQAAQDSSLLELDTETPVKQRKRKRAEARPRSESPDLSQAVERRSSPVEPLDDDLDELSPEQPMRRERLDRRQPAVEKTQQESPIRESERAEAIDDQQAATLLRRNIGRRSSKRFAEVSPELDEAEAPPTKKRRGRPQVSSSPVQQRQPKANAGSKSKLSKKSAKKVKLRAGSPILITVHRLTRPLVYEEDEIDADILNSEIPRAKLAGVNSVDVLSQICEEIIGTGLTTLEDRGNDSQDPASRREHKTKWRAVESFGRELRTRLLEHTINLDNGRSLERRVRDEHKKKLSLREDILRIRAEREQIALRTDAVRIKHESDAKRVQDRNTLNSAFYDIELAVEVGKNNHDDEIAQQVGMEVLIKRVASEVSNKGDTGGILRRIKEFNGFLERAALALEARKV